MGGGREGEGFGGGGGGGVVGVEGGGEGGELNFFYGYRLVLYRMC